MPFDINQFRTSFYAGEPARNNMFDVQILTAPLTAWDVFGDTYGELDGVPTNLRRGEDELKPGLKGDPNRKGWQSKNITLAEKGIKTISTGFDYATGNLFTEGFNDSRDSYDGQPEESKHHGPREGRDGNNFISHHTNPEYSRYLAFRCEETVLPSKQIATLETRHSAATRKDAYGVITDNIDMTFICGDTMHERMFFEQWMAYIKSSALDNNHKVLYPNEYKGSIAVTQYDRDALPRYRVLFEEIFPMTLSSQPLSWGSTNEYHRVTVTFAYTTWTGEKVRIPTAREDLTKQSILSKKNPIHRIIL